MEKLAAYCFLMFILVASTPMAWGQTKPKTAQPAADPSLQTQKPAVPPLQTQQLPAQPAQTQKPPGNPQSAPGVPGEVFLMPIPTGWKQASVDQHYNIRTMQFAPEGQAPDKAQESLRSIVFAFVKDAPLDQFLTQAIQLPSGQCQEVMAAPIAKGLINGYESVFTTRFCTKNKVNGQGEVAMFKLIQGKHGLYLGERTWRIKPFAREKPPVAKDIFDNWVGYMRAVTLCVPDDSMHPCPKGAGK